MAQKVTGINANARRRRATTKQQREEIRRNEIEQLMIQISLLRGRLTDVTEQREAMALPNLEGMDVDIAQRVIDFTCGVCYSLHGNLQKVSGFIFILTPENVDISGDYQSIIDGAFDLPSMKAGY